MELSAATLANAYVRLEPFEERHREGLIAAAHSDLGVFRHMPYPVATEGYGAWFDWLLTQQAAGLWLPHAVIAPTPRPQAGEIASVSEREGVSAASAGAAPHNHRASRADNSPNGSRSDPANESPLASRAGGGGPKIVGQSCYINPRPALACVEIGGTWYAREAQGTAINPAAKLLLLGHAFACGAERVELKTDALNMQSRNAMAKLGCTFEGVMRTNAPPRRLLARQCLVLRRARRLAGAEGADRGAAGGVSGLRIVQNIATASLLPLRGEGVGEADG